MSLRKKRNNSSHAGRRPRLTLLSLPALALLLMLAAAIVGAQTPPDDRNRRRMTPVNNQATQTQPVNETKDDTSRINAARRAVSTRVEDEDGQIVFIDTITGERWIDSSAMRSVPKMKYPLFHSMSIGVNIWDPVMRAFGQKYGIADAFVEANLHNRYIVVAEAGLGLADYTPSSSNFTFRSPMSVYFRIGANYNFLFNSNPDYLIFAGLRYGFTPFSYSIDNITLDSPYWGGTATFDIPSQHATAGWGEVIFGLRVKLWGPVSAGWTFRYRSLLHESAAPYGKPWYVPGYGSRTASMSGSFSIVYTIPGKKIVSVPDGPILSLGDEYRPLAGAAAPEDTVAGDSGQDSIPAR